MNNHALKKYIYLPVLLFPIIQLYITNELFWIIGFCLTAYIVIVKCHGRLIIPFKEYWILIVFFVWGIILGLVYYMIGDIELRDYIRDIFYYSTPIIYLYLGAWYAKKNIGISKILNSFILSGAIVSSIYLVRILRTNNVTYLMNSVHQWRGITDGGSVIIGFSLAIVFAGMIPKEEALPKMLRYACITMSSVFFLISLSRTNLLILIVTYVTLTFNKDNINKTIYRNILTLLLLIAGLWMMTRLLPQSLINEYINKILSSLTEISSNHVWTNNSTVQNNWRGYENYCAQKQWGSASLLAQLIGSGFGKRIYVGNYAYTLLNQLNADGSPADSIAVLHNGYNTQLIKLGLLGVTLYLVFYFRLIARGIRILKKDKSGTARLLFAVSLCMLIQTYYLNGLFKDYCFYPMIIILGYTAYLSYQKGRIKLIGRH